MSEEEQVVVVTCFSFQLLLIISLLLFTGRANAVVGEEVDDKLVLLQLKSFLQKNNPFNQGGYARWNASDPSPCAWIGIACNDDGRVARINLSFSNISGGIFANFSLLTELTHLDLSRNAIDGNIPLPLNQCTALKYLNLSHNIIGGELNLTGLTNLETLDLTLNRFEGGIRSNFPAICSNLVTLNISMNELTGSVSGCFDECPNLQYLDISTNRFVGEIWKGSSHLREFYASENNFSGGIPADTFSTLCNLEVLDLSINQLQGVFPNSISNCSSLATLNLRRNNFAGPIPFAIGALSGLEYLFLGGNQFDRDIPEELLQCKKLVFLDLSNNSFKGDVQAIFGGFSSLGFLLLHGNSYTGGIEESGVLGLQNLERLDLSHNEFSGALSKKIAEMPKLKFLMLAGNNFSGEIPPEFGKITGLQALDLAYNRLTGTIPPEIGKLNSLLWLMLAGNRISGEIPPEIGNCSSLLWLNLADNEISGRIPPEIGRIGRDPSKTFEANRMAGGVTAGSGECQAMKRWIPASYPPFSFTYQLLSAKTCRFVWDRLLKGYGVYPVCLNSSSPIRSQAISGYLQLSGNRLSGELPREIGGMRQLSLLHLDGNHLSGRFPGEIAQVPLVILNASNNHFSGEIPPELGGIKCLQSLDLATNNFSGAIPASLCQLNELRYFNVSFNPLLSGRVPDGGQLPTFGDTSFLGDPLITIPGSSPAPPPPNSGDRRQARRGTLAFWLFLALTIAFVAAGALSIIYCRGMRIPIEAYPDPEAEKLEKAEPTWLTPSNSDAVKVFRLDKTAFTYGDIVAATGNFSDGSVIGSGGFGVVYRGVLPDGRHVAVKKLNRVGGEAEKEFRAEMEVLAGSVSSPSDSGSGWAHPNLVALYGWCLTGSERILVYEFMEGGSLDALIPNWVEFGWQNRLQAAVEVARALAFLHHGCVPAVVHRDVKASNVLLDRFGRARVADFGLARVVSPGESHVSTVVAGTVGYVAPEYGHTWRATTKGDVYSFGVLLMELATGRRAVDGGDECLVEWVRRVSRDGWRALKDVVVVGVGEEGAEGIAAIRIMLRVGTRCTAEAPKTRPDMREVLAFLMRVSGGRKRWSDSSSGSSSFSSQ